MSSRWIFGVIAAAVAALVPVFAVGQDAAPDDAWCTESPANASVCLEVGFSYRDGEGVARDDEVATTLFIAACEGGAVEGCMYAASRLWWQSRTEPGPLFDNPSGHLARNLAHRACEAGLEDACCFPNSCALAAEAFERTSQYVEACEHGDARRCIWAGDNYVDGLSADPDQGRAISLYMSACLLDHADGCFKAGRLHARGGSTPEDRNLAEALYHTTCDLLATAQEEEGLRFVTRWTVEVSIPLVRACEGGYEQAYEVDLYP